MSDRLKEPEADYRAMIENGQSGFRFSILHGKP